jgi:hypothetical protein
MRLVVSCPYDGQHIVLRWVVDSREQLPYSFEATCPSAHTYEYTRSDVSAESTPGALAGLAVLGGVVGLLGGPLGLVLGGVVGGAVGANAEEADRQRAERFNRS